MFIDSDPTAVDILNERIRGLGLETKAKAVVGDYTDAVGMLKLTSSLPESNLTLAFIDPTDCSVPFRTVERSMRAPWGMHISSTCPM